MELDRGDLIVIGRALSILMQLKHGAISEEKLLSTITAVMDILTEYPNASVFEVKPNMLEE